MIKASKFPLRVSDGEYPLTNWRPARCLLRQAENGWRAGQRENHSTSVERAKPLYCEIQLAHPRVGVVTVKCTSTKHHDIFDCKTWPCSGAQCITA